MKWPMCVSICMSHFMVLRASRSGATSGMPLPQLFELRGVVLHHGGAHGGHYTSCVRTTDGRWAHVDDEVVTEVGESHVFEMDSACAAYMLFYSSVT
eukprot:COSAG05_NODE_2353_length_3191_cov_8.739974_2_plen_97_part_00